MQSKKSVSNEVLASISRIVDREKHWKKISRALNEELGAIFSAKEVYDLINPGASSAACGIEKIFVSFSVGYRFCGPAGQCICAKKAVAQKVSETKNTESIEKKAETKRRRVETVRVKYGVDNVLQSDKVLAILRENKPGHSADAAGKRRQTCLSRYGVENPAQNPGVQERMRSTYEAKTGFSSPMRNPEVQAKLSTTMLDRYGVANAMQAQEIKAAAKATTLSRYGAENPAQAPAVRKRIKARVIEHWKEQVYSRFVDDYEVVGTYSGARYTNSFRCRACGLVFEDCLINGGSPSCTACFPRGTRLQRTVSDILEQHGVSYIWNDRTIIGPYELDIVVPEKKLAFEVCGLYWHSEDRLGAMYHEEKRRLCEAAGYRLITIFEDEIVEKFSIVKARVLHLLGLSDRVFARKCEIVQLDRTSTAKFLIDNHIQGDCKSPVNLGLRYQGELVAVMTFSRARFGVNTNAYELVRYCSTAGVVGGASKLLKWFLAMYSPEHLISYADKRWSSGGLYDSLGFSRIGETPPNYWYFNRKSRLHRLRFTKKKLVAEGYSETKTEREIMAERGFLRVYDCGSYKYMLTPQYSK